MKVLRVLSQEVRRTSRFAPLVLLTVVLGVVTWVTYTISQNKLLFRHGDAVRNHIIARDKILDGRIGLGMSRDFSVGLGVWDEPSFILADLPVWLSNFGRHFTSEPLFAVATNLALFAATYYLGRQFLLHRAESMIGALVATFAMFMPGPFVWTRIPLQGYSYCWQVSLAVGSVALFASWARRGCGLSRFGIARLSGCILLATTSSLTYALWAPVTIPFLLFSFLAVPLAFTVTGARGCRIYLVGWCIVASPLLLVGNSVLSLISSTASARRIQEMRGPLTDSVVREVGFALFGDMAGTFRLYRYLVLSVFVLGITMLILRNRHSRTFGWFAAMILLTLVMYAKAYEWGLNTGIEIGPNPDYLAMYALPILALVVATFANNVLGVTISRSPWKTNQPSTRLGSARSEIIVACLLASLQLAWVAVWAVDNRDNLSGESPIPPNRSQIGVILSNAIYTEDGLYSGRVLLIQDASAAREGFSDEILYPSVWTKKYYKEFQYYRIPMFNSYHHLLTADFVQMANRVFTDGRPFVRQWIAANYWDRRSEVVAQLLGVCFVLSEVQLSLTPNLVLAKRADDGFLYKIHGCNRTGLTLSQSRIEPLSDLMRRVLFSETWNTDDLRDLQSLMKTPNHLLTTILGVHRSVIKIRVESRAPVIVLTPFEYSKCAMVRASVGTGKSIEVGNLLLGLIASSTGTYTFEYRHLFPLQGSCT